MKLAMKLTIKLWKNGVIYLMLLRSEALNYLLQKSLIPYCQVDYLPWIDNAGKCPVFQTGMKLRGEVLEE